MKWVTGRTLTEGGLSPAEVFTQREAPDQKEAFPDPEEGNGVANEVPFIREEDEEVHRAKKRAMDLLTARDYTEAGLRQKLATTTGERRRRGSGPPETGTGFSGEAIDAAVAYVRSYGYIDDARFACSYIRCHMDRASRVKIRGELLKRGVDEEVVDTALEEAYADPILAGDDPEVLQIRKLMRKRGFDPGTAAWEERQRFLAAAARRGFTADKVRQAMEKI